MPWTEVSIMDRREEFVGFASHPDANISSLCRVFGISRKTGYKWLGRAREDAEAEVKVRFGDASRRPHHSPRRTPGEIEEAILGVRGEHPAWGARKIAHVLLREGVAAPSPSTVHAVLLRRGCLCEDREPPKTFGRFEMDAPNLMWQMDFKGQVQLGDGSTCYPLTVIDDHSRFAICLQSCDNQKTATVQAALEQVFRRYGLPAAFYVDNGPPWGGGAQGRFTPLGVWLLKLAVDVIHATPHCPQGRGKNERLHRSLKAEVFDARPLSGMIHAQKSFDTWRDIYNYKRPHEALAMQVPASRYRPSNRPMPASVPTIEYDTLDIVRKVNKDVPLIGFKGKTWRLPKAFRGENVAIRQRDNDIYAVCFGAKQIATIDLKQT